MKVLTIHASGAFTINDVNVTLEWLQRAVGGHIEAFSGNGNWHGYCNEEGKLMRLPVNATATAFAHEIGWPFGDFLSGDVVFLGNAGPKEADVPEWVLEEFGRFLGG